MDESIRYQFFRHYFNARQDEKIINLLRKEGWQGYGLFWALLEFLGPIKDHKAKCAYEDLAWDLRIDEDIIKRVVENYGLFKVKGGYFFSESFSNQMDELTERYKRRSTAGRLGAKRKAELKQNDSNAQAMLTDAVSNATAMLSETASNNIREEEREREDKKDNNTLDSFIPSDEEKNNQGVGENPPTQELFLKKKKDFEFTAMSCEGGYPKAMRKAFVDYWTQPLQGNPAKMLYESKRAFDIPVMLRKWFETEWEKKNTGCTPGEEVITFDQYYKRYGTTECKDGWQTRHNPTIGKMEYFRRKE